MSSLSVSKRGGTINVSVSSSPSSNTSYGTLPSYASRNGNAITLSANTGYNRSFELTVTATTVANAAYYGTATASSAWTVAQAGELGPQPPTPAYTWRAITNNTSSYVAGNILKSDGTYGGIGLTGSTTGDVQTFTDALPFTITAAMLAKGSAGGTIALTNGTGGSIICYYNSQNNVWEGTGSLTINSSYPDLYVSW